MHDLVIRGGRVVDGSGNSAFVGDVAIDGDIISKVGEVEGTGRREINAKGLLVTPGFVDLHTHYDGQVIWSEQMLPSSNHGVTTVLTGNCGIGFAPCRPEHHTDLVEMMEGVEDIPEAVTTAGLTWEWETFPEYLDAVEQRPHDIDIAALLPHSPLRAYVMGERGIAREPATSEDLEQMRQLTREAISAGALGFGTSRVAIHRNSRGEQIPSFQTEEEELFAVADVLREGGVGIFQMVSNAGFNDFAEEFAMMARVAERAKRPFTYTQAEPDEKDDIYGKLAKVNSQGIDMKAQVFPRPVGLIVGLETSVHPFSLCPSYAPLKGKPRSEIVAAMRDLQLREKLIEETPENPSNPVYLMSRQFEMIYPIGSDEINYEPDTSESVASRARREGRRPEEVAYDLLLEEDGKRLLMVAIANFRNGNLDYVETAFRDENVVIGLGDGGAHYGMICDASYPTYALAYWTRDRSKGRFTIEEMVNVLSRRPAQFMGLEDRGLIAPGYRANLNVIDYENLRLAPPEVHFDLPGGGRRLHQRAEGYVATIVNGEIIVDHDSPTDARPGRLIRGAQKPESIRSPEFKP